MLTIMNIQNGMASKFNMDVKTFLMFKTCKFKFFVRNLAYLGVNGNLSFKVFKNKQKYYLLLLSRKSGDSRCKKVF
jgi:hypothetical protein